MIYGIDVSHYQGSFDMHRARAEDFEFVFIKATEGTGFVDARFKANLASARAAGLLVAAYHYQREDYSARAQADHVARVVPPEVPVILDVEEGGGGTRLTGELLGELHARGFGTPLLYLPEWYWQRLGRPDLSGFPPLWKSRYPDNNGGYASEIYQRVPEHFWSDYGNNRVAVLQFTSSATVAGQRPVDANAYRGNRQQLEALLDPRGEDMRDDERNAIFSILEQLTGSRVPGQYPGWKSQVNSEVSLTTLDFIRAIDKHTFRLHQRYAKDAVATRQGGNGHEQDGNGHEAREGTAEQALRTMISEAVTASLGADDPRHEDVVDAVTARLSAAVPYQQLEAPRSDN
ncbi:Lyzozyme M1 (1,4-beta-N-acetylmuramidase), GH25 family [Actinopolyspora mzabensis]|uniref:Lyzozyme M1 (1,4-beta-N-acetylmuramidase), GH25 family n=1 Tax=Actinopolyspora mzabensis TaxID=995066 RepID=A0A1G9AY53_ACTMZ|nr:glycoside hydrolase family 25 protein [Actinopolyspora mzabensis]SDK31640.1 Lyzozyme M1 (1,4-beta-N-acetylmuramidase), GH25 family [Actinopolyspora mzabensis]